jgi:dihydrolipoamide dehydrogenase
MSAIEAITVPDIGDFKDVNVIEVLVAPGDTIEAETPLITLESDKASMEVPSPQAGKVQEIKVKVGDKLSRGDLILLLEVATSVVAATSARPTAATGSAPAVVSTAPALAATAYSGGADRQAEVLVLGAGPGGYSAAFRAADLDRQTVLVERYPTLGGVCLNVGCIPSKALLHAAKIIDETRDFSRHGLRFAAPEIDLDALRGWKDGVVKRLTDGLAGLARQRQVQVVTGVGQFLDPQHLEVTDREGKHTVIRFEQAIIAAGSEPVKLPFIPDDPRIMDSTGALQLHDIPKRLLVLGGGIIGLEMATVYYALGSRIVVVELLDGLMTGTDRDIVKPFQERVEQRYEKILLKTEVTQVEALPEGLRVTFAGENAPPEPELFDRILVAVGRIPNGHQIGVDRAGVTVNERGFIPVDKQRRTNVPHIFAIGDIVGHPLLAHKAIHEGHVAAEVCAGLKAYFDARVIPSVAYTDPEVAWAGLTEGEARAQGIKYGKGVFPWAASGRSLAIGRDEGMTKILFDAETQRVIGIGIVGPHAGDLIAEGALAIEMGCDAVDIGKTIHPHPTLSETIGMAAEAFAGTITDLYLPRKKP